MFELNVKNIALSMPYQNLTGNAYNLKNGKVILPRNTSKNNMNKEQYKVRKNMIVRLIQRCVMPNDRDRSKKCLRDSLNNVNNIAHLPFVLFTDAFKELLTTRVLSSSRDSKLIASFYRILSEFHDQVAENGDDQVKDKLNKEADKYQPLSDMGKLSKMLRGVGGTRRKRHARKQQTKRKSKK